MEGESASAFARHIINTHLNKPQRNKMPEGIFLLPRQRFQQGSGTTAPTLRIGKHIRRERGNFWTARTEDTFTEMNLSFSLIRVTEKNRRAILPGNIDNSVTTSTPVVWADGCLGRSLLDHVRCGARAPAISSMCTENNMSRTASRKQFRRCALFLPADKA